MDVSQMGMGWGNPRIEGGHGRKHADEMPSLHCPVFGEDDWLSRWMYLSERLGWGRNFRFDWL